MTKFSAKLSKKERRRLGKILKRQKLAKEKGLVNMFKAAALQTVTEAKKEVPVFGGVLRSSLKMLKADSNDLIFEVGTDVKYAKSVEFGRKSGKMPNIDELKRYARLKFNDENAAFPIALKIKKDGTKPQPYLNPAFEEEKKRLIRQLRGKYERR